MSLTCKKVKQLNQITFSYFLLKSNTLLPKISNRKLPKSFCSVRFRFVLSFSISPIFGTIVNISIKNYRNQLGAQSSQTCFAMGSRTGKRQYLFHCWFFLKLFNYKGFNWLDSRTPYKNSTDKRKVLVGEKRWFLQVFLWHLFWCVLRK